MTKNWVFLPGVPLGPHVCSKLQTPMEHHRFRGLHDHNPRSQWSVASFSKEVHDIIRSKIVLGQDYGGLVGATASLDVPIRALVLTGTALGPWWYPTRLSALPILERFFYRRFGGTLFAKKGVSKQNQETFLTHFTQELSLPDLPERMRKTALALRPPKGLANNITAPLFLVWGKQDSWYPPIVAHAISRATGAPIYWIDGGHYCMWESPQQFDAALQQIEKQLS